MTQNENSIQFDIQKMKAFSEQDAMIRFMHKDLMKRGHTEAEALELAFNTHVLEDSTMERIYRTL